MKFNKKRTALASVIAVMALTAVTGCSDKKESSEESVVVRTPLEFSYNSSSAPSNSTNLDAQDPTAPDNDSSVPEFIEVTDANGENVTEYVYVTDSDGQNVTEYVEATDDSGNVQKDENDEVVTEVVEVTTAVNVTEPNPEYSENDNNNGYVPYTDSAYAMWIDISKDEDFVFQDAFITVKFKVKDNIPDGEYPITISNPDFSSLKNGVTGVDPDIVQNGTVYVSKSGTKQKEFTESDGFVVYVDNVECKQGDEITVNFYMKNNPGMVGMNFWFDYDKNAMDIVKCSAAGEFEEIANAAFGEKPED